MRVNIVFAAALFIFPAEIVSISAIIDANVKFLHFAAAAP